MLLNNLEYKNMSNELLENLNQLKKIMGLKFNTVLFDNMNNKTLKAGVKIAKKYYETEASGNVTLKSVKKIAATFRLLKSGQSRLSGPSLVS